MCVCVHVDLSGFVLTRIGLVFIKFWIGFWEFGGRVWNVVDI